MKALYLLLIPFLFFQEAGAQTENRNTSVSPVLPERYTILTAGFGIFFPSRAGHDVATTFPYTLKDVDNGNETNEIFNGRVHDRFSSPINMIDLLDVEFVRKHHSIDMGVGLSYEGGGDHGFYLKGGYRYILSFGGLQLKPGIDLYYIFGGNNTLGKIDNKKKEIFLPGAYADDHFTVTETDEYSSSDETVDADHLDVDYIRSTLMAEPKIVLAVEPSRKLTFSLEAGWMFQVLQYSRLEFRQFDDGNNSNVVGHISQPYNGSMNGLYAAIKVGINILPK
jgi:hypothetical protein